MYFESESFVGNSCYDAAEVAKVVPFKNTASKGCCIFLSFCCRVSLPLITSWVWHFRLMFDLVLREAREGGLLNLHVWYVWIMFKHQESLLHSISAALQHSRFFLNLPNEFHFLLALVVAKFFLLNWMMACCLVGSLVFGLDYVWKLVWQGTELQKSFIRKL